MTQLSPVGKIILSSHSLQGMKIFFWMLWIKLRTSTHTQIKPEALLEFESAGRSQKKIPLEG